MQKVRTVIFGGSFDPVHIGHTSLAGEVLERNIAEEVWFMVSPHNPLKNSRGISDEALRLEMVRLAVECEPRFVASDFEFFMPRPSYTLHTLQALDKSYPEREFILLIGADNWEQFDKWYCGNEIVSHYKIIVYPRGVSEKPNLPHNVIWLHSKLYNVSSTMLRESIAIGADVSSYIDSKVLDFINVNKLYRKQ